FDILRKLFAQEQPQTPPARWALSRRGRTKLGYCSWETPRPFGKPFIRWAVRCWFGDSENVLPLLARLRLRTVPWTFRGCTGVVEHGIGGASPELRRSTPAGPVLSQCRRAFGRRTVQGAFVPSVVLSKFREFMAPSWLRDRWN